MIVITSNKTKFEKPDPERDPEKIVRNRNTKCRKEEIYNSQQRNLDFKNFIYAEVVISLISTS
jgi:hypothetical protein